MRIIALFKPFAIITFIVVIILCVKRCSPADFFFTKWPSMEVAQARFPGCCGTGQFDCGDGGTTCIPIANFHDGSPDCVDGSDEACFSGQVQCGDFCASAVHIGECLLSPSCCNVNDQNELSTSPAPRPHNASFCPMISRRLCGLDGTISCKGYGECIFDSWLLDGKRDCYDGSDEDMSYVGLFKLHARDIFYDLGGAEVLPIQPITTSREISGDLSIQPTQVPPIQPLNANIEPIAHFSLHPTGLTPFSPVSATTTAANIYASSTESTEFLSTFDTSLPSTGTPMLPELFLQPAVVPVSPVSAADSTLRPIPPAIPIAARIGSGGHVAAPIRPVSSFSEQMLSSTNNPFDHDYDFATSRRPETFLGRLEIDNGNGKALSFGTIKPLRLEESTGTVPWQGRESLENAPANDYEKFVSDDFEEEEFVLKSDKSVGNDTRGDSHDGWVIFPPGYAGLFHQQHIQRDDQERVFIQKSPKMSVGKEGKSRQEILGWYAWPTTTEDPFGEDKGGGGNDDNNAFDAFLPVHSVKSPDSIDDIDIILTSTLRTAKVIKVTTITPTTITTTVTTPSPATTQETTTVAAEEVDWKVAPIIPSNLEELTRLLHPIHSTGDVKVHDHVPPIQLTEVDPVHPMITPVLDNKGPDTEKFIAQNRRFGLSGQFVPWSESEYTLKNVELNPIVPAKALAVNLGGDYSDVTPFPSMETNEAERGVPFPDQLIKSIVDFRLNQTLPITSATTQFDSGATVTNPGTSPRNILLPEQLINSIAEFHLNESNGVPTTTETTILTTKTSQFTKLLTTGAEPNTTTESLFHFLLPLSPQLPLQLMTTTTVASQPTQKLTSSNTSRTTQQPVHSLAAVKNTTKLMANGTEAMAPKIGNLTSYPVTPPSTFTSLVEHSVTPIIKAAGSTLPLKTLPLMHGFESKDVNSSWTTPSSFLEFIPIIPMFGKNYTTSYGLRTTTSSENSTTSYAFSAVIPLNNATEFNELLSNETNDDIKSITTIRSQHKTESGLSIFRQTNGSLTATSKATFNVTTTASQIIKDTSILWRPTYITNISHINISDYVEFNCTERNRRISTKLTPLPFCDCPISQMRDIAGKCRRTNLATFRARLIRLCGARTHFDTLSNEAQASMILSKLSSIFKNHPICVRTASDLIILNMECDGRCTLHELHNTYSELVKRDEDVLKEIDIKIGELESAACYRDSLNDCHTGKAECIADGLHYRCECLPGTNDTDGTGRNCIGMVSIHSCTEILGVCVLAWVLLFLLLCLMLPILTYWWIKYCSSESVQEKVERMRQRFMGTLIPCLVKQDNTTRGAMDVESAQPTTTAAGTFTPTISGVEEGLRSALHRSAFHSAVAGSGVQFLPTSDMVEEDEEEEALHERESHRSEMDSESGVTSTPTSFDFAAVAGTPLPEPLLSSTTQKVKNDSELRRKSEYAAVTPDAHSKLPKEPVIQEDTQTGIVAGSTIWEKFQHLGNYYSGRDEVEKDPARRHDSIDSLEELHRQRESQAIQGRQLQHSQDEKIGRVEMSPASQQTSAILRGAARKVELISGGGPDQDTIVLNRHRPAPEMLLEERIPKVAELPAPTPAPPPSSITLQSIQRLDEVILKNETDKQENNKFEFGRRHSFKGDDKSSNFSAKRIFRRTPSGTLIGGSGGTEETEMKEGGILAGHLASTIQPMVSSATNPMITDSASMRDRTAGALESIQRQTAEQLVECPQEDFKEQEEIGESTSILSPTASLFSAAPAADATTKAPEVRSIRSETRSSTPRQRPLKAIVRRTSSSSSINDVALLNKLSRTPSISGTLASTRSGSAERRLPPIHPKRLSDIKSSDAQAVARDRERRRPQRRDAREKHNASSTPSARSSPSISGNEAGARKLTSRIRSLPPPHGQLPPPRLIDSLHSHGVSRRQLSNIKERTDGSRSSINTDDIVPSDSALLEDLPVSLGYPEPSVESLKRRKPRDSSEENKRKRIAEERRASRQKRLPTVEKMEIVDSVQSGVESEADFIAADVDLDLPGPYMKPVSSSHPRPRRDSEVLGDYDPMLPYAERSPKLPGIMQKKPPIPSAKSSQSTSGSQLSSTRSSTVARKIARRRTPGGDVMKSAQHDPVVKTAAARTRKSPDEIIQSTRDHAVSANHEIEERVHSGCLKNRPPWNPTRMRPGEKERIPLNWNIGHSPTSSRSGSYTSLTGLTPSIPFRAIGNDGVRRIRSSGDMNDWFGLGGNVSRGVGRGSHGEGRYSTNGRRPRRVVTFDEDSIEVAERSRSMTDMRGKKLYGGGLARRQKESEVALNKHHKEWFERLKKDSKAWLDYD